MRFARKMLLLVVAAAAVMALVAPSASATNAITYVQADGKTACPAVTGSHPSFTGGCLVHVEGEVTLFFHVFGFEGIEAKCHVEFNGRTGGNGEGRIFNYHVTQGAHNDPSCSETVAPPCSEEAAAAVNEFPWHGSAETDADGVTRAHYDVCLDPVESGPCEGEQITTVTESGALGAEVQVQKATDSTLGGSTFCEFTIDVASEAVAPAEKVHQRP